MSATHGGGERKRRHATRDPSENPGAPRSEHSFTDPWLIQPVPFPARLAAAARRFCGTEAAWLDGDGWSSDPGGGGPSTRVGPAGRFSLVAGDPIAVLEQRFGRPAEFRVGGRVLELDASGWALWLRVARRLNDRAVPKRDVCPGWVGYAGFESADQLDRFPTARRDELGLPLLRFALYDRAVVVDRIAGAAALVLARGLRERLGLPSLPVEGACEQWQDACRAASAEREARSVSPRIGLHAAAANNRLEHEAAVRRALDYIAAGDIYQVNLARRMPLRGAVEPWSAFAQLLEVNPAPYSALLRWRDQRGEERGILSCSPELMLDAGGPHCVTRPIKGTRRRAAGVDADAAAALELLRSEKDACELAMIVDLHRNDLGRVCTYGSVRVEDPRRLETHPGVHHTVGVVRGMLRAGLDAGDALAACFPAGSISGVPKIRAMQIIRELEPAPRGVYTGALGGWGLNGRMIMSVAIRIVQFAGNRAVLHAGGGVVADSDPAAEYDETEAKAAALLRGLGVAATAPRRGFVSGAPADYAGSAKDPAGM